MNPWSRLRALRPPIMPSSTATALRRASGACRACRRADLGVGDAVVAAFGAAGSDAAGAHPPLERGVADPQFCRRRPHRQERHTRILAPVDA